LCRKIQNRCVAKQVSVGSIVHIKPSLQCPSRRTEGQIKFLFS
jgi:hypothetical protein